ncbi:NAD-dependent epimerase/dehydratase family protein [Planctomicrobium piriforme]|uniref:NAD-dependent epimerase/dehydratase family protein n=1 Tax=Planctomicrobium piriforme TaxID=1576369 RepID=UPI001FEA44F4|nr:NAD-dependent epimerase/dehydratase family protein [Planctomicrobium piriforme]
MNLDLGPDALLLVTGGTGLVGSHVIEKALARGCRVRALVRAGSDTSFLQTLPVELSTGSLTEPETLPAAVQGVTHVVHCAAKVGDWGPVEDYRLANVTGLRALLESLLQTHTLRQFVHISSLGVYPAQDHYGTDETAPTNDAGIDGYTLTKVEAEHVIRQYVEFRNLKAVILRPGWIYGARDRTVLPKLIEKLRLRKVVYLGSGEQMLNQIYVDNLVDAVLLALGRTDLNGETFNLTDGKLVSRIEFMETICEFGQLPKPVKHVPLPVAKGLAAAMETTYRILGKKEAPLLSQARIKFLGLNLDYSIDKARRQLGYEPKIAFRDGMRETMNGIAGT